MIDRQSFCSGVRSISGGCCGDALANCARENMANLAPGAVRPDRPRRCFAAACETHVSASTDRPRCESQHISFARPVSTTYRTSSIVTEVSAMFVATTIFRTPFGGRSKILRWSLLESEPYRGRIRSSPTSAGSRSLDCSSFRISFVISN